MSFSTPPFSISSIAGLWKRELIYEPKDVLLDSAQRDGSLVLWFQAPSGEYCDVRNIKCEQNIPRGFAGKTRIQNVPCTEASVADPTAQHIIWERKVDSCPSSCPTGVDQAIARLCMGYVNGGQEVGAVLIEEGDGYLEVWQKIAIWDDEASLSALKDTTGVSPKSVLTIGHYPSTPCSPQDFAMTLRCGEYCCTIKDGKMLLTMTTEGGNSSSTLMVVNLV